MSYEGRTTRVQLHSTSSIQRLRRGLAQHSIYYYQAYNACNGVQRTTRICTKPAYATQRRGKHTTSRQPTVLEDGNLRCSRVTTS